MKEFDYELLNTQIESMKEATDEKQQNEYIFAAMELLLDHVDFSEETLSEYEGVEVRSLFSSYRKVTRNVCKFFESAKAYYNPEIMQDKIANKLSENIAEIENVSTMIENIEKTEAELFAAKKKLEELQAKYDELKALAERLRKTQETVNKQVIKDLEIENKEIRREIDEDSKAIEKIKSAIAKDQKTLANVKGIYTQKSFEQDSIESNIIEIIDSNYEEIKEIFEQRNRILSQITDEIADMQRQYSALSEHIKNSRETLMGYQMHLGENSEIVSAMKHNGIETVKEYNEGIDSVKQSIEDNLKRYDNMIKAVIDAEEKMRDDIRNLQNKK